MCLPCIQTLTVTIFNFVSNFDSLCDSVLVKILLYSFRFLSACQVYHIGVCERCQKKMASEKLSSQQMFFAHIHAVVTYLKTHYSHITVLMWDDMMRFTELSILKGNKKYEWKHSGVSMVLCTILPLE